jgi:hypothetical protein
MLALIITLIVILIYSTLYKQKADAFVRKLRHSEYGFVYILAALLIIVIIILSHA